VIAETPRGGRLAAVPADVPADVPARVLRALGLQPRRITALKDNPGENGSWLLEMPDGARLVLRRYHDQATLPDLAYEHSVLRYLARAGWTVPEPAGELVDHEGLWYCPTRYVPGAANQHESTGQRRRRGRDLARLNLALRGLGEQIGQRPGWRAQHAGETVHTSIDFDACARALTEVSARLGGWAGAAAAQARDALAAIGAGGLPVLVVHGDFHEQNVHYAHGRLAGVIDFGLTHLDSRPYELAIARTYRAPEAVATYRSELARGGWPLSPLEEAALGPVSSAFRVDMATWFMDHGRRTGRYDLAMIERQLSRTGTVPP
jgi:Ser/Thr protein kinase RdoA (MazF antagonist)